MRTAQLTRCLVGALLVVAACGRPPGGERVPDEPQTASTDTVETDRPIEDVVREHSERLMALEGVVSVGQALCDGSPCIRVGVLTLTDSLRRSLPERIEGYRLDVHETGLVRPRE